MLIIEHTETSAADVRALWSIYADVANWNRWDAAIETSRLNGDFVPGTSGVLKPAGGPSTPFTLVEVEANRRFSDVSHLPLARLTFEHVLEPVAGGTRLTHRIAIDGPLAFVFARLMGPTLRRGVPEAMRSLAALAAGAPLRA
jgi:hypothetical protein